MIHYCLQNLNELKSITAVLSDEQFQYKSSILSGASIGQHVRHILEFYTCLLASRENGIVNYDKRERNLQIESSTQFASYTIEKISEDIFRLGKKTELLLEGNFSSIEDRDIMIKTSFHRELAYCLEHSIHHQALIKVGLFEMGLSHMVNQDFGVAPATIRHHSQTTI